jgi:hypothetical protein
MKIRPDREYEHCEWYDNEPKVSETGSHLEDLVVGHRWVEIEELGAEDCL